MYVCVHIYIYIVSLLTKQNCQTSSCIAIQSSWQQDDAGSNTGTERKSLIKMQHVCQSGLSETPIFRELWGFWGLDTMTHLSDCH